MYSSLLVILLFCGSVWAGHVDQPSKDWKELHLKNGQMGLSQDRVDRAIEACQVNQLSVSESEELFCPVYTAQAEGLPTECVFLKIEEGLAKGISWQDVHVAADNRLSCLRQANALIISVRQGRGGQHSHLVMHTCMALESGLPEEVLQELFNRPGRFRYGRLIHVIEAGEALQLAGLPADETLQIMNECLDRDLSGAEVMRVVDVIQTGLQRGKDFKTLHETLWVVPGIDCSGPQTGSMKTAD